MNEEISQVVDNVRRAFRRSRGVGASLLFVTTFVTVTLAAQTRPFSSGAEYQSMLSELRQQPIRPSRMSAGTLLQTPSLPNTLRIDETAAALQFETPGWRLEVAKDRWQMTLTNKETLTTWQLADSDAESAAISWIGADRHETTPRLRLTNIEQIEKHEGSARMRANIQGSTEAAVLELSALSPTVIRLSVRVPRLGDGIRMRLNLMGAGPFFGLGERFGRARLDGLKTTLRSEDLLGRPGHNWTYIPVPFLFTPRGLGLYLDTARVTTFDLSEAQRQRSSIEIDGASADCYFFVDPGPEGILRDYTALMGRSPVPPPWAFGVWICSYQGPARVLDDARRLRQYGIPSSAIWVFDVMGKGESMGWPLWWTGYYPSPRDLTDQLHQLGFKVLTYCYPFVRQMLNPYILPNPSFDKGVRNGFFVLNDKGQPTGPAFEPYIDANLDFTNPKAVDWWEEFVRRVLTDESFDGWMEDFGEWIHDGDRFASGTTGREMANLNPLFYHKITYEIARQAKPDVVEFVRSGYAGSQGYTRVVWGGDQFPSWTSVTDFLRLCPQVSRRGSPDSPSGGLTSTGTVSPRNCGFAGWSSEL